MSFLRFILVLGFISGCSPHVLADSGFDPFSQFGSPLAPPGGTADAQPETKAKWEANTGGYTPGKTFQLTLSLSHPDNLHSYYINPGTVGMPPEVTLKAPAGFKVEGPYWSIPHIGKLGDDVYYGSSSPSFVWLVTPETANSAEAVFEATGFWQLCGDGGCLPPTDPATFKLTLPRGEKGEPAVASASVPLPREKTDEYKDWQFTAVKKPDDGKHVVLIIRPSQNTPPLEQVYFFSHTGEIFPTASQALTKSGNEYQLLLPLNEGSNPMHPVLEKTGKLKGMLTFSRDNASSGVLLDLEIGSETPPPAAVSQKTSDAPQSLLKLFIALFIGGLILNLMPCVFPVIGLKVMSFVQMGGGQRRKVMLHSLTFVIGVLVSFWAITTLLFILKKSIPNINWAFWLEEPWVIFSLLILMLLMGLSMFGVFEIGASATSIGGKAQQKKGYLGSFYSGVLCTAVATPCTAPFLGASIGPAISLATPLMYVAFTFMGLGMALPYLILGIFPNLVQKLPRPGAWMESFKQGLSFLLFGTAAWLLWTYWAFYPEQEPLMSLVMILGLVVLALAGWIKGRWDLPYRSKTVRRSALIIALLLALSGLYLASPLKIQQYSAKAKTGSQNVPKLVWETWSPEIQANALSEGRPVYIDFTARWCATCLMNKSVAYTEPVINVIHRHNILMLKADKTTSDPVIDEELRKLGRSAVPVNVLYVPGDPEPKITVPLLTGGYLERFLLENLEK